MNAYTLLLIAVSVYIGWICVTALKHTPTTWHVHIPWPVALLGLANTTILVLNLTGVLR